MYDLRTRNETPPSDEFDTCSRILVAVLSFFPLDEVSEIYPLEATNYNTVLIHGEHAITKRDIFALLFKFGALRIMEKDKKINAVPKTISSLKVILQKIEGIALIDSRPRRSKEQIYSIERGTVRIPNELSDADIEQINVWGEKYMSLLVPRRTAMTQIMTPPPVPRINILPSLLTTTVHTGRVVQRATVTPTEKHTYRDVTWTIANREYVLPIHYIPLTLKDKKEYDKAVASVHFKDHKIAEIKKKADDVAIATKNEIDAIAIARENEIGDIAIDRKNEMDAIAIARENEMDAIHQNNRSILKVKDAAINDLKTKLATEAEEVINLKEEIANLKERRENSAIATNIGENILKLGTLKKLQNSTLAQRMYSAGLALTPQISISGYSKVIPMVCAAFLSDLGVLELLNDATDVANICPSPTAIRNHLDRAREIAYQQIGRIIASGVQIAIIHDKGNKNGADRLLVQIAYFCDTKQRVEVRTVLGDMCSCGTDEGVADTINQLFFRIELNIKELLDTDYRIRFNAQGTDSGGGGVSESIRDVFHQMDRVAHRAYIATCAQHAHNRPFQVAFETVLGQSGLTTNSLLQFLHTCWSIQDALGENFLPAWDQFVDDTGNHGSMLRLIKPLLTRWSYVTKCATAILDRWSDWDTFLEKIFMCTKTKEEKMARQCLGMRKDHKLKCELEFIVAFGKVFFTKHFEWLQRIDAHTKLAGFFSHEMLLHLAVMEIELADLQNSWSTSESFAGCMAVLDSLPLDERNDDGTLKRAGKETTMEQFSDFFKQYKQTFDNQFYRWKKKLAPLAIASSNSKAATIFAKWYIAKGEIEDSEDETDILDGCTVHINCKLTEKQWVAFLKTCDYSIDIVLQRHLDAVNEIASGSYLYEADSSENTTLFLHDVKRLFYIIPTVTQMVEAAVQESSLCSQSGKGEDDTSTVIVTRSFDVLPVLAELRRLSCTKKKGGNQHMKAGINGERTLRSDAAKRNDQMRSEKGKKPREQVHATKLKARSHMQHMIDTLPTKEEWDAVRRVNKKRKNGNANVPTKAKIPRIAKALECYVTAIGSTRKRAENILVVPVTTPDQFDGKFKITGFSKDVLKPYCNRELLARSVGAEETVTKAKAQLGRIERAKRQDPPSNLESMIWSDLKKSLECSKGGLWIQLLDETNKRELKTMFQMTKRGYVAPL